MGYRKTLGPRLRGDERRVFTSPINLATNPWSRIVIAKLIAPVLAALGLPIIIVAADLTLVADLTVIANTNLGGGDAAFALLACASAGAAARLVATSHDTAHSGRRHLPWVRRILYTDARLRRTDSVHRKLLF